MMCQRTKYKNCSCWICRRRKDIYVKKFLDFHRSKQAAMEKRTNGAIPSYTTLQCWWSLPLKQGKLNVRQIEF